MFCIVEITATATASILVSNVTAIPFAHTSRRIKQKHQLVSNVKSYKKL